MECEEPFDKILYFKNILPNHQDIVNTLLSINSKAISPWKEWYASKNPNDFQYGYTKEICKDKLDIENIILYDQAKETIHTIISTFIKGVRAYADVYNLNSDTVEAAILDLEEPGTVFGLNKYNVGADMGPHVDRNEMNNLAFYVLALYVNDDYTGGEIRFVDQNITIKPEAGSLIIFPGVHPYVHEVLKITEGNKMIINHYLRVEI